MLAPMEQTAHPPQQRQVSILAILIVAIATPATLALSYYQLTGDPTFRPLALTVERLIASGQGLEHLDVQGFVIAGSSQKSRELGARFGQKLERAFYGKGLEANIRLHPEPTEGPAQIIFLTGGETHGPFHLHDAPQAVRIVSEAAKRQHDPQYITREHTW